MNFQHLPKAPQPITEEQVEATIADEVYFTAEQGYKQSIHDKIGTNGRYSYALLAPIMFCVMVLKNGFRVIGVSEGPLDIANNNEAMGRDIARKKCLDQIYTLLAYEARTKHKADLDHALEPRVGEAIHAVPVADYAHSPGKPSQEVNLGRRSSDTDRAYPPGIEKPAAGLYSVVIRQGDDWRVRDEATQALHGRIFHFSPWWYIGEDGDPAHYRGEWAMRCDDASYPKGAPPWIASGDLVLRAPDFAEEGKGRDSYQP